METFSEDWVVVALALVAADARNILLQRYKLCRFCLARQIDEKGEEGNNKDYGFCDDTSTITTTTRTTIITTSTITNNNNNNNSASHTKPSALCYICRGLMDGLDIIADQVMLAIKEHEFNTFLIGATLPTQIYEREDALRARLKIRGRESIKNQLTKELGLKLAQITKRKADYMKPDITINLTVDKENNIDISVKSRLVVLTGRYTKKLRGLPQRQDRCQHCEGKGCDICDHSGLSGYDSVEGVIAHQLISKLKGETPKFSWIGSEDQNSLVLGSGRPFSVRIYNPKKRDLGKISIKGKNGITAAMSVSEEILEPRTQFIVKTKIHIKCEKAISKQDLKKLKSLAGVNVNFENRSKIATKKIYFVGAREFGDSSREFMLTIVADGGLMIKQFVGGEEYMKPNISEVLDAKCECITFDVLDVKLQ